MTISSSVAAYFARVWIPIAAIVAAGPAVADFQSAPAGPRTAQATGGATTGNAPDLQGIGLTSAHRRVIYEHVAGERAQEGGGRPEVGAIVADSVRLDEIPIEVKDQVGLLRDFKFAKLQNDQIVIVDPASRKIVDIVTREEGR